MELQNITFGDRVAENEAEKLSNYFVQTEQWDPLKNGDIDVVFGPKGSGKSALYTLLLNQNGFLSKEGIFILSAEKPTGKTVFSDITSDPPTQEGEFVTLWKIYICLLIVDWLILNKKCYGKGKVVSQKLKEAGLIDEQNL